MSKDCNHVDPKTWKPGDAVQGRVPVYCPGCKKFMGYLADTKGKK